VSRTLSFLHFMLHAPTDSTFAVIHVHKDCRYCTCTLHPQNEVGGYDSLVGSSLTRSSHRSQFQISDGVGGQAQAEANAVGVDPFAGCDLSTVDATSLSNLKAMREVSPESGLGSSDPVSNAPD
jgi:hypothetical protein